MHNIEEKVGITKRAEIVRTILPAQHSKVYPVILPPGESLCGRQTFYHLWLQLWFFFSTTKILIARLKWNHEAINLQFIKKLPCIVASWLVCFFLIRERILWLRNEIIVLKNVCGCFALFYWLKLNKQEGRSKREGEEKEE